MKHSEFKRLAFHVISQVTKTAGGAGVSDHSAHAHTYTYAHINFSLNLSREKRENSAEKGESSSLKSSAADV
jgi:hypothetical protein